MIFYLNFVIASLNLIFIFFLWDPFSEPDDRFEFPDFDDKFELLDPLLPKELLLLLLFNFSNFCSYSRFCWIELSNWFFIFLFSSVFSDNCFLKFEISSVCSELFSFRTLLFLCGLQHPFYSFILNYLQNNN